jgi:hypothetical protein
MSEKIVSGQLLVINEKEEGNGELERETVSNGYASEDVF